MDVLFNVLHLVGAVFVIGPMAVLPMIGLRAVRTGQSEQVIAIARTTAILSYVSSAVAAIGFALLGMADPEEGFSLSSPWVIASIILYAAAVLITLLLVVPALRRAATATAKPAYPAIAASSGISALLLLAVVVLMVWKP